MREPRISVTETPAAEDLDFIGKNLSAFNEADVGPADRRALAVLLRADERLVAGLSGHTAWGWLYTQWLWIAEDHRGRGLAGWLLAAAEEEALRRGCHGASIDTFNRQALHVYQKAGYAVFGALPDFPAGRTRSYLAKKLAKQLA